MVMDFSFLLPKKIVFGSGKLLELPKLASVFGRKALLVSGKLSFLQSEHWDKLSGLFNQAGISCGIVNIPGEPSPEMIDESINSLKGFIPDVIIAIGGGSVIDAGKAISAMIHLNEPVLKYLEGVGDGSVHPGIKVPFIAVPTTAGTGSEATKNAVISHVGATGFKKSLRHDNFIPDIALIDPTLTVQCPSNITTWSGMDAFTQLLESYLSTNANPLSDSIAMSGLEMVSRYLEPAVENGSDIEARSGMAYAALCSGITLANAGLGIVHGYASSVGGRFNIPHGLVCASLMGLCNEFTLNHLMKEDPDGIAFKKYVRIGQLFYGSKDKDEVFYAELLINKIHDLSLKFNLPKLSQFGFDSKEIASVASQTSNKNNPVELSQSEKIEILERVI
jgi:alcohol dehydrogenase class IV